ncbi:UbiX family flavin prenyltransferase [Kushneria phosphatilytica]|uniref:Flavin prenyltransferase UbiX n=1 Tax=Kushneria phosphatilytica TaxID=657387 RepID=A0A1S1NT20_9GAMM|nr:UbiX family flavin prenyltransferase [Kushneria phosphatilytica]OHV08753.1 aromatic acid decarboxylase [Kushneria phosphatilytica]QEL12474.1 UbiX family flavin prenyltransferase [Kushneria phosphatilytica]
MSRRRLIVAITGASGFVYGARALEMLRPLEVETHLILSKSADLTRRYETGISREALFELADEVHPVGDIGASLSSGSFRTLGMLVAPCSVKTMSEIASGATTNLISRAADVVLKERRRLVLMLRETPLHLGHLRTMTALTEMGAIMFPPVPAFYARPDSLETMIDHSVARALDLFDIDIKGMPRWGENLHPPGKVQQPRNDD